MSKIFDIVINSKYNPDGSEKLANSISKATVKAQAALSVFKMVGGALLDMARAGDPERFAKLDKEMQNLEASGGRVLMQVLGPLIDKWTEIIKLAETGLGPKQQADEFFSGWIKNLKEEGTSAEDTAVKLKAMSDAAIELTQKAKDASQVGKSFDPFLSVMDGLIQKTTDAAKVPFWVNVKDVGIDMERLKAATADASSTFTQYVNALRAAGIEVKDLNAELKKFEDFKGIKIKSPEADIAKARDSILANIQSIADQTTALQVSNVKKRDNLLEDIAIAEGRRLQDVALQNARQMAALDVAQGRQRADLARQNARTLQSIEAQHGEALRVAAETYAAAIASIDQSSAENRTRIEEDFQEKLRQIKESSGSSIEDAIQRRDARALAKAYASQAQQISQAERDHEKQLRDNEKAAEQQKAQAQAAYEAQQQAADEAAQKQKEALEQAMRDLLEEQRRAKEQALEDQRVANEQALQDQKTSNDRSREDMFLNNQRELKSLKDKQIAVEDDLATHYKNSGTLYRNYLNEISAITDGAALPTSPLMQAIVKRVNDAIGDALSLFGVNP